MYKELNAMWHGQMGLKNTWKEMEIRKAVKGIKTFLDW